MPDDELDVFARAGLSDADFSDDDVLVERDVETEVETEVESGPARDDKGRFASKEPASEPETAEDVFAQAEAPAAVEAAPEPAPEVVDVPADLNLTAAERAEWVKAGPLARGAVTRRVAQLQEGYRQTVEPLKPFLDHYGSATQMAQYMNGIAQFEARLRQDPAQGMASICQALGVDVRAVAAQIVGQPAPTRDAVIDGLRSELNAVKAQVGTVHQTFEQQRQQTVVQSVTDFAAAHPRFDELSGEIAQMLKTGYATDLQDAYTKADRLSPSAPAPTPPLARTPAANISVSGTPANGSNPNPRTPPPDRMASIDWALNSVGL